MSDLQGSPRVIENDVKVTAHDVPIVD
jgi:hypothetical protein